MPVSPQNRSEAATLAILVVNRDRGVGPQLLARVASCLAPWSSSDAARHHTTPPVDEPAGDDPAATSSAPAAYAVMQVKDSDEGITAIERAAAGGRPFMIAFVDVDADPLGTGFEVVRELWTNDPALQIVLCHADVDFSWETTIEHTGRGEGLHLIRNPLQDAGLGPFVRRLYDQWRQQSTAFAPAVLPARPLQPGGQQPTATVTVSPPLASGG
ncbi:MAG: hypothetical protein B7733_22930 [Myxococcales bacterium FL481]|nr:MAG: hypothetical protein B7733_22930 [Myxococcales bacterium FL481]